MILLVKRFKSSVIECSNTYEGFWVFPGRFLIKIVKVLAQGPLVKARQ